MNGRRTAFRRMVVGLPQSTASNAAVEAAADLAEFLQIELHATFVADPTLLELAGSQSVRELRTLGQGWQSIDLAQITRDIDHAAISARRGFTESVKSRAIKTSFVVVTDAEAIAALVHADDIVAIIEPRHPAETITRQFTGLVDAALNSAAAVLTIPRRIVRTTGPILAVAAAAEDPSIGVALRIAAASKERLIVMTSARRTLVAPSCFQRKAGWRSCGAHRCWGAVVQRLVTSAPHERAPSRGNAHKTIRRCSAAVFHIARCALAGDRARSSRTRSRAGSQAAG